MRELPVVESAGAPRARGQAHGEALRERVQEHWRRLLAQVGERRAVEPRRWFRELLADTDFRRAARRWTPELLEEVAGIGEGAGLAPDDAFALQLLDEEWCYAASRAAGVPAGDRCSALAALGEDGAPTLLAQNMDLGSYTDGLQALLVLRAGNGAAVALLTIAGLVGLTGASSAGFGVCVNSLMQLPSSGTGLPVAFVIRGLLERDDLEGAERFLRAVPHASGQSYVLAAAERAACWECSATGADSYAPPDPRRFAHTNHPLAAGGAGHAVSPSSRARLAALDLHLGGGSTSLAAVKAALASRDDAQYPVCRLGGDPPGAIDFTTGAVIYELHPAPARATRVHVCPGPPVEDRFVVRDLDPPVALRRAAGPAQ